MPLPERSGQSLSLLILAVVVATVVLGVFHAFPGLDLTTSSMFCAWRDGTAADGGIATCNGFPAAGYVLLKPIRTVLFYTPPVAAIGLLVAMVYERMRNNSDYADRMRYMGSAAIGFIVGPLLIVNMLLKANSGRPRPYESRLFGGILDFVPAGDFSGACLRNCSFISGEAASAGWLLCLLPLVGGRHGKWMRTAIVTVSVSTPLLRLAMGGHYLSDILLGWLMGASAVPLVIVGSQIARTIRDKRMNRAT